MAKMYLMCGLSGAGKTTFAKKFAEENHLEYVSIDNFYKEYESITRNIYILNGIEPEKESIYDNNDASFTVWIRFFEEIHRLERMGKNILIDTNAPTFVKRQQFIDWFPTFDEYNLIYIDIKDEELRKRNNASRGRVVPDDEMERMRKEFEEPVDFFSFSKSKSRIYACPEKRWDNIIVYRNINNEFIRCVDNDDLL